VATAAGGPSGYGSGRVRWGAVTCHQCGHENLAESKYCSQCAALLSRSPRGAAKPAGRTVVPVVLGIAAFIGMLAFTLRSGSVEGEIHARGRPFGTWSMKPTDCYSGQHQNFFGVWIAREIEKKNGREGFKGGIKLMKSPLEEWNVYVESPLECESFKCKLWELQRSSCKAFEVDVRKTDNNINDIWVMEGQVTVDCTTPEGGALTANLKFDGCH
jgi:hypothetical protein